MKYQKILAHLQTILSDFKSRIDALAIETAESKAKIESQSNIYTKDYISEMLKKCDETASNKADTIRQQVTPLAQRYFALLKQDLNAFFDGEISPEISNKAQTIKAVGLTLSQKELDLLSQKAKSYYDMRVLGHLANETGLTFAPNDNPYFNNIDALYKTLSDYENGVLSAMPYYCGEHAELMNTAPKDTQGNVASPVLVASATQYFENRLNGNEYINAMDSIGAIIPQKEHKTFLTEEDTKLIDALIDERYPTLAREQVAKISSVSEDLADLFSLDERYSAFVVDSVDLPDAD